MLVHFIGRAQGRGRNAEANSPALSLAFAHHQRGDLPDQHQTAGLVRVQNSPQHGPPGFFVEEIGEALGFVAIDGDLGILYQMRDALLLEHPLG